MPLLGAGDAGAVIQGRIESYDAADDLSRFAFEGGVLILPGQPGLVGERIRIRVAASDVILARERPEGLSALNILPATITGMNAGRGPGVAVGLRCGQARFLARVTRRSAREMGLESGQNIHAIIKATAVARRDIGHGV